MVQINILGFIHSWGFLSLLNLTPPANPVCVCVCVCVCVSQDIFLSFLLSVSTNSFHCVKGRCILTWKPASTSPTGFQVPLPPAYNSFYV